MISLFDYPPPAIYDHPSSAGVVIQPLERVRKTCYNLGVRLTHGLLFGCSWRGPAGCTIVIPEVDSDITQDDQNAVRRVENANCNGWPKGSRE